MDMGALAIGVAAGAFMGSFLVALCMAICMDRGRISRTEEKRCSFGKGDQHE